MSRHFFASISRNAISLTGCAVALASAVLIIILYVVSRLGHEGGPYLGILTFLILPLFFLLGLILIPIGIYFERRRLERHPEYPEKGPFPIIDLNLPRTRGAVLVFLGLTVINVVILAGATYKGVHMMESTEFCGAACHTVMEPEYTAYQRSAHSSVRCAECHIGPGADWFVKSKLDGAWQMVAVAFDLYPRPVPTPLHDLRPARETCEQCHWPSKFHGDKLQVKTSFADDEQNTELTTAVLLKVGGLNGRESAGIHWHVDPGNSIRYRSDLTREDIYEVRLSRGSDGEIVWKAADAPEEGGEWREMDCVDCHNRPSHRYRQPAEEIDRAIHGGLIDRSLPFVKREGLRIIDAQFPTIAEAKASISQQLGDFYVENYPQLSEQKSTAIEEAGVALGEAYAMNVFPKMNVWWNTYPDHIGHQQSPGCMRCHGSELRDEQGAGISEDCNTCHVLIARGEQEPKTLALLQGTPVSAGPAGQDAAPMSWECSACHHPRAESKMTAADCETCHLGDLESSLIHEVPAHAECTNCHQPHDWRIDPQTSCLTCHGDRLEHAGGLECNLCHN